MRTFSLSVLLALLWTLPASGEDSRPVTFMGRSLLPRTDLVVLGRILSTSRLGTGTLVAKFEAEEVLFGADPRGWVLLITTDPAYFPETGLPCVFFLGHLRDRRFSPVARVEVTGSEGPMRLKTLRQFLAIEAIEPQAEKVRKLHDLLMLNLLAEDPFLVWNAARELAHFTKEHADSFDAEDREKIERAAAESARPVLKELLGEAARNIAAALPEPAALETAPPDPGPDGGAAPQPAPPERPRIRVPPPEEFKRALEVWKRGGLAADEREVIVREVSTRHLKYAEPILLDALTDPEPSVRALAARNLGEGLFHAAEKPLARLLATEKEPSVLEAAIQSLGVLESDSSLGAMIPYAGDPALLRAVAFAAARIGTPEARSFLLDLKLLHSGAGEEDRKIRDLVEFLFSDAFRQQEAALAEIRRRRLR